MIRRMIVLIGLAASSAAAQPVPTGPAIDPVAVEFATTTGGMVIFFGVNSATVGAPATQSLAAKAQWLLLHPDVKVRIEGHGDGADTRDHALAMGAKRAAVVSDQLILLGVPPPQLSTTSWGNEQPGAGRAEFKIVR
jgi:peptidoglycan-associated lipoprotein